MKILVLAGTAVSVAISVTVGVAIGGACLLVIAASELVAMEQAFAMARAKDRRSR